MRNRVRNCAVGVMAAVMAWLLPGVADHHTAWANPVSLSFSGIVTQRNGDFDAMFGVAPGSPVAITGSFTYDPAGFAIPGGTPCGNPGDHCLGWDTTDGSLNAGALRAVETINGISMTFDGTYYGGVLLATGPGEGGWPYGYWLQAFELLSETSTPYGYGVNAAELNLGSLSDAPALVNPALDPGAPLDLRAVSIQANASYWSTATLEANWMFDILAVPEPATGMLLLAGILAIPRRRRLKRGAIPG